MQNKVFAVNYNTRHRSSSITNPALGFLAVNTAGSLLHFLLPGMELFLSRG